MANHQHLRQVLINLVNNAIKFTDKGSVNLRVFRVGGDEQHPRIRFEVLDTGVGMPAEFLNTIFDDFTQAEHKTNRNYGGTGLGNRYFKGTGGIDGWVSSGHGSQANLAKDRHSGSNCRLKPCPTVSEALPTIT